MENTLPQTTKKPWAKPEIWVIDRDPIHSGTHAGAVHEANYLSSAPAKYTPGRFAHKTLHGARYGNHKLSYYIHS
ncbi:MAG: hypothetical protein JWQ79_3846 [Mucilaginibacter sp.]|nr:hypothetical protein [Mucilaginibacter sp.]